MQKQLCLMHANCQGNELETLLLASSGFSRAYRLARYTNYTRESIPAKELETCAVFLYQRLGPEWGEYASDSLLACLPASAVSLQIPNMLFKGYWPFWTDKGPIDFGDWLLNRLIDEGAPKPAILSIYLQGNITTFVDLEAALAESIAIERKKEEGSCVATVDFVLERWQRTRMFHTVNHPGRELLVHTAQGVLKALDLPELTPDDLAACCENTLFPSYADFDLPIHPQAAAFHHLQFIGPEQTFAVFGRRMTFAQYISRYIDCRRNGMDGDFLAYLQIV